MNLTSRSSTPALAPLREYDIDPHTGFVPPTEPLKRLPRAFAAWEALVPEMSALLRTSRLRQKLTRLEVLDPLVLTTSAERERALLLLTVFVNGWVWGGREPNLRIPRQLAVPLCAVATALDRPPIVHYASMALNNWCRIDGGAPLSADNARMQIQFLGGVDEDWFFIGSLGVEIAGASLPRLAHAATVASHQDSDAELAEHLTGIATGMNAVLQALDRMREWCDPYVFYHRVRPYLAGWPTRGAIYEGVSTTPLKYVGGSAGQSSLIQAIDAALGVDHGQSMAGTYLRTVRRYMPVGHRRFVEDVENASCVRARALDGSRALRDAYNAAIEQVDLFRCRHIEVARDYVANPSGLGADARGTGGTAFADFLGEARRQTISMRISG